MLARAGTAKDAGGSKQMDQSPIRIEECRTSGRSARAGRSSSAPPIAANRWWIRLPRRFCAGGPGSTWRRISRASTSIEWPRSEARTRKRSCSSSSRSRMVSVATAVLLHDRDASDVGRRRTQFVVVRSSAVRKARAMMVSTGLAPPYGREDCVAAASYGSVASGSQIQTNNELIGSEVIVGFPAPATALRQERQFACDRATWSRLPP
jgi:hypothetical protein